MKRLPLYAPVLFGGAKTYYQKVLATASANLVGYWPMDEASGTTCYDRSGNGLNGAYTNVTVGQTGIGDGRTSVLLDAGNDIIDIYSAGLSAAFSGLEGTFSCWFKASNVSLWTDGATHALNYFVAPGLNALDFYKRGSDRNIFLGYRANGVWSDIAIPSLATAQWFHFAYTWSLTGGACKVYINGVQQMADKALATEFVGSLNAAKIGSLSTTAWLGSIAHAAIWSTPLTLAQIRTLAGDNYAGFKGVLLNFDDGDASVYNAFDYLRDNGLGGTFYVVSSLVDTAGYLTSTQLQEMDAAGSAIGNHTKDHSTLTGLSEADQETQLADCKTALDGWGLTANSDKVAYPTGGWNADTLTAMAATGMVTGRTTVGTAAGANFTVDPRTAYKYEIGGFCKSIGSSVTLEQAQTAITNAQARGNYTEVLFHRFVVSNPSDNQWAYSTFNALVDWLIAQGIPVKTIADFYAEM